MKRPRTRISGRLLTLEQSQRLTAMSNASQDLFVQQVAKELRRLYTPKRKRKRTT